MAKWQFWKKEGPTPGVEQRTAPHGIVPSPHSSRAVPMADTARLATIQRLERRKKGILFDLEQAEAALAEDNPWHQRIELLTESIGTVESDIARLAGLPATPAVSLPPVPIANLDVQAEPPTSVSFWVGPAEFRFEEDLDWSERGHQLTVVDLRMAAGNAADLVPGNVPLDRAPDLVAHLERSLFAFATDARDRAASGESAPVSATLADLAQPCPICGGWQDWKGVCAECVARAQRRAHFDAEANRLRDDVAHEIKEREDLIERLPLIRRQLQDVTNDLAKVGA